MADAWVRFARGGRPDVTGPDGVVSWAPHDAVERPTMVFGEPSRMQRDPLGEERALWMQTAAHA